MSKFTRILAIALLIVGAMALTPTQAHAQSHAIESYSCDNPQDWTDLAYICGSYQAEIWQEFDEAATEASSHYNISYQNSLWCGNFSTILENKHQTHKTGFWISIALNFFDSWSYVFNNSQYVMGRRDIAYGINQFCGGYYNFNFADTL